MTVCESSSSVSSTVLKGLVNSSPACPYLDCPPRPLLPFLFLLYTQGKINLLCKFFLSTQCVMVPLSSNSFPGPMACSFYYKSIRAIRTCGQGSGILICYKPSLPGRLTSVLHVLNLRIHWLITRYKMKRVMTPTQVDNRPPVHFLKSFVPYVLEYRIFQILGNCCDSYST